MHRFLLFLLVFGVACNDPVSPDAEPDTLLIVQRDLVNDHKDPYDLREARVEGDELVLEIGYGGGCATHRFTLVSTPAVIKTSPPGADLILAHDAGGDLCEAYFQAERRFDLRPLRRPDTDKVALFFWPYEASMPLSPAFTYRY